ncbi:MAG: hypothetical protein AAGF23_27775, partial [Acidobacteriota bacterium]
MRPIRFLLSALCLIAPLTAFVADAADAAGPPCRPCAGIHVENPATAIDALREGPKVDGEARLYVSWPVGLDGTADTGAFQSLSDAGATPWAAVTFTTPAPAL